jgi:hypothetical protein
MPFSSTENHSEDYWKRHFFSYLKPLIEKDNALEAFRSEPLRGNIANQIIFDLVTSEIVVADLTDHNPNVFWELGVRQSYKHCTVTIAEVGTIIPFHFSHKGILFYNSDHLDNHEFEEKFLASLNDCLNNSKQPDSPVLEAMGERGTLYSLLHSEENERKLKAFATEIISNKKIIQRIIEQCNKNKNSRKENALNNVFLKDIPLNFAATDLLITNRYLDLDDAFYLDLFTYQATIKAFYYRVRDWQSDPETVERWLVELYPFLVECSEQIEKRFDSLGVKYDGT